SPPRVATREPSRSQELRTDKSRTSDCYPGARKRNETSIRSATKRMAVSQPATKWHDQLLYPALGSRLVPFLLPIRRACAKGVCGRCGRREFARATVPLTKKV